MTKILYFLPMMTQRTVALLAYDSSDVLDVTGPASVFSEANRQMARPVYDVQILSPQGGLVVTANDVTLHTRPMAAVRAANVDTLLISGGELPGLRAMVASVPVRRWVRQCAKTSRRFGSICTGSSILAEFGLVDGKRISTHWSVCEKLAKRYPNVIVDPEALFVVDGKVWTSAGVTTGIDMALAMLEEDLGAAIANTVARQLVLYVRRPGHQSQFSTLLQSQVQAGAPFAELICWIQNNLDGQLGVPALAARAGLSERSFYRKFTEETGSTPAQFVQNVRLDAARILLAQPISLKHVAGRVGLPHSRFTEAFERRFGLTPRLFREVHGGSKASPDRVRSAQR